MYVLSPHDQSCLSLVLWCFFVGSFLEFKADVDFEVAYASLFPLSVLEVVEFRSTFYNNLFIFFTGFA